MSALAMIVAAAPDTPSASARQPGGERAQAGPGPQGDYRATIRRTSYGIPHIRARDYGGLGYGYGYAFAQDNICTIADSYVTVSAERSRFFGPDGSYAFRSNRTIPLDAPLGDHQFERRGGERIPIHGGPGTVGVFNAINVPWVAGQGYPNVPHGSSFVYVARFTGGCPESRSILTYSLSENPASPHFADQTRLFSRKRWVDMRFCEDEINSDPNLRVTRLSGR